MECKSYTKIDNRGQESHLFDQLDYQFFKPINFTALGSSEPTKPSKHFVKIVFQYLFFNSFDHKGIILTSKAACC